MSKRVKLSPTDAKEYKALMAKDPKVKVTKKQAGPAITGQLLDQVVSDHVKDAKKADKAPKVKKERKPKAEDSRTIRVPSPEVIADLENSAPENPLHTLSPRASRAKIAINARLDPEVYENVKEQAKEQDVSIAKWLERAAIAYLPKYKTVKVKG